MKWIPAVDLFSTEQSAATDFTILVVCTGNICRSPLAAQYLEDELAGLDIVTVKSAGTMGLVGRDMPDQAKQLAARRGRNARVHVAQELSSELVRASDLVLAMSREHRKAIVSMFPRSAANTFTIREFERLASALSYGDLENARSKSSMAARLRAAVAEVASRRGLVLQPADQDDDDVIDPYRLSDAIFDRAGDQLYPAADVVVRVLRDATAPVARS
jgi:protein-tyrosine phosphatase